MEENIEAIKKTLKKYSQEHLLDEYEKLDETKQKGKLLLKQFPLFLLSILLILIGSLAEGCINPLLLMHLAN